MDVSKFIAPEIIFGRGAVAQVGESARRLGARRVFVVSDPGVAGSGGLEKVLAALSVAGLAVEVWTGVTPNPRDHEIARGAERYVGAGCDAVVGAGGGSAIDAAKAVATVVTNGGTIADYEGIDRIVRPLPPMVAVPTTAGSGSEASQFSIIVDTKRRLKMTIISKSLVPDIAICDPLLLATVPHRLTADTGMDVLTHAIEAYVSLAATPLTDVHALAAMRLVARHLPASVASQTNAEAKTAMAMASLQAGLAFSNAILGAVHAMTHPLGGYLDMPHGAANAILLPYVMRFNLISSIDRYGDIARSLGGRTEGKTQREAAELAIKLVTQLAADVGIPRTLADLGLTEEPIPHLAANACQDSCLITNPRDLGQEEIETIFRAALYGDRPGEDGAGAGVASGPAVAGEPAATAGIPDAPELGGVKG
ncbi:MAG: alcohol dehydrogenase [Firmicutes bacterium RBG_13_65_8]|nr:MAG: alcohol dehydrogenase [Firmicutes bacterium RBG_13_65_8]